MEFMEDRISPDARPEGGEGRRRAWRGRLLALAAAGALLLPVAANAGNFPAGKEAGYMAQCTQVASGQGVDAATAKKHCDCGAQAIKKNFTDAEIADGYVLACSCHPQSDLVLA